MNPEQFPSAIETLRTMHGNVPPPPVHGPLELIIWENIAYLADTDRRSRAFDLLRSTVGTSPDAILAATDDALLAVAKHGIVPAQTVVKLRRIAQTMEDEFPNGLEPVLKLPVKQAVRELRKFPMIGEPAAEKILLVAGGEPMLCFESNGLRVVERLGCFAATGRYDADYKSARKALAPFVPPDAAWLTSAHLLLRRHGQTICRRTQPNCASCPLMTVCDFPKTGPQHQAEAP